MNDRAENILIYDGACPFCARYTQLLRVRKALGQLRLVDARQGGSDVMWARLQGYDLDTGMVLRLDGVGYHGAAAMHRLALMGSSSGVFNRANALIFRHKWLAQILYPALKTGRGLVLLLLGRRPIGEGEP